ncbi:hypothetical protein R69927_00315 [Paraburkholderia domus]|jgi:uncharacterized protein|uniref:YecA family protein n=1 Tax=Paraburkholderia domus TaxID=2793075 RepID=A0A9N8QS88_9BURK|nr:UPF0149 family protein [Paraburkholderia domus]MBK5047781.1 UPF0149 family protein [Burkholderia sp. R-70006]MBK5063407.1 UPF0149 family protein [Burkholderia sp. R-70199]MBK5084725.1 UPF0149 family protein [Burkholderia sp. R-69927]MBK5119953.1 UPF0149 family protein [Burkholderia sp. R-69980]MBK5163757.1 UPF0149 family protein [Burkholderia sp. R-70211]MBK5178623.1 UPF0149 family protein [Burkholderia sp. R-69749]MCI0147490.1 UPF0149 family protein [Paraburkholderia sediminicola]
MSKSKLSPANLATPLSEEEFDELDEFLISDLTSEETLTIEGLDGYLTAMAIGPNTVPPSYWLPGVWGPSENDAPAFESMDQAQHILGLILRNMNGIIACLEDDPDEFEPVFGFYRIDDSDREYIDGEAWAVGFMQGLTLVRADWQALFDSEQGRESLNPIRLMGARDLTREEEELVGTPEQDEALTKQIPASIAAIYRFWLPYRQAVHDATIQRTEPKVGRNDPCPCGSGKKFKKCCGAADTVH